MGLSGCWSWPAVWEIKLLETTKRNRKACYGTSTETARQCMATLLMHAPFSCPLEMKAWARRSSFDNHSGRDVSCRRKDGRSFLSTATVTVHSMHTALVWIFNPKKTRLWRNRLILLWLQLLLLLFLVNRSTLTAILVNLWVITGKYRTVFAHWLK